jgi:hypothetical protein
MALQAGQGRRAGWMVPVVGDPPAGSAGAGRGRPEAALGCLEFVQKLLTTNLTSTDAPGRTPACSGHTPSPVAMARRSGGHRPSCASSPSPMLDSWCSPSSSRYSSNTRLFTLPGMQAWEVQDPTRPIAAPLEHASADQVWAALARSPSPPARAGDDRPRPGPGHDRPRPSQHRPGRESWGAPTIVPGGRRAALAFPDRSFDLVRPAATCSTPWSGCRS